jgi:hypothetical protein
MNAPVSPTGERLHSKLGASSAYRWTACPGSVRLCETAPSRSTHYARLGTAAHELAARCLKRGFDADFYIGETIVVDNDTFEVDDDMAEAVQVYLDTVRGDAAGGFPSLVERWIEQGFAIADLHPDFFGTADAVQYWTREKLLRVYDYKHGAGVAVEANNNKQGMYYALGVLLSFKDRPVSTIEIVIVQPRAAHKDGPVRRFQIEGLDLLDWSVDLLAFAKATEDPNAPLNPGDWCRFCPAAGFCEALKKRAQATAQKMFMPIFEFDTEEIASILRESSLVEDWLSAVWAFAQHAAEGGTKIPGYKLVRKQGRRTWAVSDKEAAAKLLLEFGLKYSETTTKKLITPAQVEKLLTTKADKERLAEIVTKPDRGVTLVVDSDRRDELAPTVESLFETLD